MDVLILMSSGDEDTWENVRFVVEGSGNLLVTDDEDSFLAYYAAGMWMKVEVMQNGDQVDEKQHEDNDPTVRLPIVRD